MIRDATILIRLTKEEKAQINKVARAAGGMISEWVRGVLLEKAGMDCQETTIIAAARSTMPIPASSDEVPKLDMDQAGTVFVPHAADCKCNECLGNGLRFEMPRTPSDIPVLGASTEEKPMKVNGEPPLDIPEIPLNDPQVAPSVQSEPRKHSGLTPPTDPGEPPSESGYWVDGEWVPD